MKNKINNLQIEIESEKLDKKGDAILFKTESEKITKYEETSLNNICVHTRTQTPLCLPVCVRKSTITIMQQWQRNNREKY